MHSSCNLNTPTQKCMQAVKHNIHFKFDPLKGTVARDGFFAYSSPSSLVSMDLKHFWYGSTNYRITAKIKSLSVLGEYAE